MKAILLFAGQDSSNSETELIWKEACINEGIILTILDSTNNDGQKLSSKLNIKSYPALIIDSKIIAVGHPNKKNAKAVIQELCT